MIISLTSLLSGIIVNGALLTRTAKPGFILGPIAKLLGFICDKCFGLIYGITPLLSWAITIIIFTVIVKILLLPLAVKQQKSMAKTQAIQPQMKAIQDKYEKSKDDPEAQKKMSAEISELYRKNNANPFSGCLPLLIQMPILFALYYVVQQPETYINQISDVFANIAGLVEAARSVVITLSTATADASGIIPAAEGTSMLEQIQYLIPILTQKGGFANLDLATVDGITTAINALTTSELQSFITTFYKDEAVFSQIFEAIQVKDEIYYFFFLNMVEAPGWKGPGIVVPIVTFGTTLLQNKFSIGMQSNVAGNETMQQQQKIMMIVMPFLMAFMSIGLPVGLGLYWNVSNIWAIVQQLILNNLVKKNKEAVE